MVAASACGTARWCTTVTGACSQRPTQVLRARAHLGAEQRRQLLDQRARAGQFARQPAARAASAWRRRIAVALRILAHDLEVVEARDLVDLDLRERAVAPAPRGGRRAVAEAIVQRMQVLDEQIAPQRERTERRAHLVEQWRRRPCGRLRCPLCGAAVPR